MYLAENLKFLREQNGKTQGELAVLFGIEQKTIVMQWLYLQRRILKYAQGLYRESITNIRICLKNSRYYDMLRKIVDAPTTLHMKCSVRMLIPIIDRKLKERGL